MKKTYLNLTIRLAAIVLLASISTAQAEIIIGTVVGVADGDTLTVFNHDKQEVKMRLAEIDSPEKRQAFGTRSKQSLSALCFVKYAEIIPQVKDLYKRTVAYVKRSGIDANTEQVKRGMAWAYTRYVKDHHLYVLQREAKGAKRGFMD